MNVKITSFYILSSEIWIREIAWYKKQFWANIEFCDPIRLKFMLCIIKKQIILQCTMVNFPRQLPITLNMQLSGPLIKMWFPKACNIKFAWKCALNLI